MKIRKIGFLIIIVAIVISSIQVNPIQAQEITPTFGLEIKSPTTVTMVDGGFNEPNNHWVHKNGLLWSKVQEDGPNSNWNVYHVKKLDAYLKTMHEAGMEVILTIRSTPDWARSHDQSCGPMDPGSIDAFANFVGEAVSRYKNDLGYVSYFEIWNEPDAPFEYFGNKPTSQYGCWGDPYDSNGYFGGGYYGKVLKAVYPKLKAAAPDAQLVIGGLLLPADPDADFWKDWKNPGDDWVYATMSKFFEGILYECQGTECFDFANFHGYSYYFPNASPIAIELQKGAPHPLWGERGGQIEGKLSYLEDLMVKYSVDKPIILTEAALLGDIIADYNPDFEATKADYLVWLYTRNIAKGIHTTTWFKLDDYGWRRSGLLDRNNNPLPAYHAYTVLTDMLAGAVYQRDLSLDDGSILGFEFKINGIPNLWVLFSEDGETKTIHKNNLPPWYHSVVDLFGNKIDLQNDRISFNRPIYIKGNTAPTAVPDHYILNEGAPITVRAPGVLLNDINYDGDTLTAELISSPSAGTVQLNPNGSFRYTPGIDFKGQDSFSYKASDGTFTSEATVTIQDGMWLFLPLIHR